MVGATQPSRASVQARLDDEHRRQVQAERDRRRAQLVSAAEAAQGKAPALRQALALPQALELTDDEVDYGAMERARAELDLLEFTAQVAANGDALTRLPGHELIVGNSAYWFMRTGVLFDKRGDDDPTGTLYLTTDETIFHAPGYELATVPWSKVVDISRSHRTVSMQRRDRKTPHLFIFDTLGDACIAEYVARRLWSAAPAPRTTRRGGVTA